MFYILHTHTHTESQTWDTMAEVPINISKQTLSASLSALSMPVMERDIETSWLAYPGPYLQPLQSWSFTGLPPAPLPYITQSFLLCWSLALLVSWPLGLRFLSFPFPSPLTLLFTGPGSVFWASSVWTLADASLPARLSLLSIIKHLTPLGAVLSFLLFIHLVPTPDRKREKGRETKFHGREFL